MKKRIILIAALIPLLSLGMSACNDFLEEELVGTLTGDYFNTEAGVEDLVRAAYEPTRTKFTYEWGYAFWNFGTDEFTHADQVNHNYYNTYDSRLNTGTDWFIHEVWATYYNGINTCNTGIRGINNVEGVDLLATEAAKNERMGELRFLRGLYYFTLVQQFGDIPLLLQETAGVLTEIRRAPVAEVYEAIIRDFRFAAEHLPEKQSEFGRARKGAAQHYLAKAYLTRGSAINEQRGQKPTDIDSAAHFADLVINSPEYKLAENFDDLWDLSSYQANAAAQENDEIIFAAQWNDMPTLSGRFGNQMHLYFIMAYDQRPGMKRDAANGRPFRRAMVTDYAMDIYDRKNDSRFYKSFITTYISNNDTNIPEWTEQDAPSEDLVGQPKFTVGDTAFFVMINDVDNPVQWEEIQQTRYNLFPRYYIDENGQEASFLEDRAIFPSLKKHLDPFRPNLAQQQGVRDGILARLGETYLIAAEAYGRKGDYGQALTYINELRRRAAYKEGEVKRPEYWMVHDGEKDDLSGTFEEIKATETLFTTDAPSEMYPAGVSSTPERFIHFILNERTRELIGELHRWEDLVRTETLLTRAKEFNPDTREHLKPFHGLRPIPQEHLETITLDGETLSAEQRQMEQNPGY